MKYRCNWDTNGYCLFKTRQQRGRLKKTSKCVSLFFLFFLRCLRCLNFLFNFQSIVHKWRVDGWRGKDRPCSSLDLRHAQLFLSIQRGNICGGFASWTIRSRDIMTSWNDLPIHYSIGSVLTYALFIGLPVYSRSMTYNHPWTHIYPGIYQRPISCPFSNVSDSEAIKTFLSRYSWQFLRENKNNPKNKISNMICKPLSRSGVPELIDIVLCSRRISVSDHRLITNHPKLACQSPPTECLTYFCCGGSDH